MAFPTAVNDQITDAEIPAEPAPPLQMPRSLFAFSILYGGMVCIAGVLANKQVALGPLGVEAGIFAFLMLVATSSAVAELFDRPTANKLVLIGFVPLIFSILLTLFVLQLPEASFMTKTARDSFEQVMWQTPRIWIGGIVAYGTSQLLNVTIFSALKRPGGRLLWLRAATAGILSQIVDTLIFITIAFFDPDDGIAALAPLLGGQMLAKVVLSAVLVPPLIYLFVALGRRLDARA